MKIILFGIALILAGIASLLVSWMAEARAIDIIGLLFVIIGLAVATYGAFKKE